MTTTKTKTKTSPNSAALDKHFGSKPDTVNLALCPEDRAALFRYWTLARLQNPLRWGEATAKADAIRATIGDEEANHAAFDVMADFFSDQARPFDILWAAYRAEYGIPENPTT